MTANKKNEKIVNTTMNLFIKDGVKKISMDEIAENAHVSKVTLYKYFKDKDTLYHMIAKHIFSFYIQQFESIISSNHVLTEKLFKFMDVLNDFTTSGKFDLCKELIKYNHDIDSEFEQYLEIYKQSMITLINDGIKEGLIRPEFESQTIFYYIDMGVVYFQHNADYRNKMLNDNNFQHQFLQFYISNIFIDGTILDSAPSKVMK